MACVVLAVLVAVAGQNAGTPRYRYEAVSPPAKPGAVLYAHLGGTEGVVMAAADPAAHRELLKSVGAGDDTGTKELLAEGKILSLQPGTAVRVLEVDDGPAAPLPSYEVRVLDGKYRDKKAWLVTIWARRRVEASDPPKAKPAPRKKRR